MRTPDGGCVVAGGTGSFGAGRVDVYLVKVSADLIPFLRGDANTDGFVNIADTICILSYLFGDAGSPCKETVPSCRDAADVNDDGGVNIADAIKVVRYFFAYEEPPPDPFDECGLDRTGDDADCVSYTPCE